MAVALKGITSIVDFGSLMITAHRGSSRPGLLLTVGSTCGLVASPVVLPVILRLITREAAAPAADPLIRSLAA